MRSQLWIYSVTRVSFHTYFKVLGCQIARYNLNILHGFKWRKVLIFHDNLAEMWRELPNPRTRCWWWWDAWTCLAIAVTPHCERHIQLTTHLSVCIGFKRQNSTEMWHRGLRTIGVNYTFLPDPLKRPTNGSGSPERKKNWLFSGSSKKHRNNSHFHNRCNLVNFWPRELELVLFYTSLLPL